MPIGGKTILITGAGGIVGSGLAASFAAGGARLLIAGRRQEPLEILAQKIHTAGGVCDTCVFDLRSRESLERLVEFANEGDRRVDVLINNAADTMSRSFRETSLEEIENSIATNLTGALQLTRLIVPGMIERGSGAIVNISSLAGYKPNPTQTVYSIAKGGINAMSEALFSELRHCGIHVVNVALMGVGTGPMRIPVETVARRIERALDCGEPEVFFYRSTQWLMRLYGLIPSLKRR
ncbi:MAG: SDR family NAD(P)-dependent oxidoreductase [Candidatus Hydrogenedentes bacterium]|nr:SDR family NAD(P)-dependent oxidoreductase [Candidatus Hydrogenedentota bacterium]